MSTDALAAGWGKTLGGDRKQFDMFFDRMIDGFAYHKIVVDKAGKPIDYIFLEVNRSFEAMTGLRREKIIGKRVTDVLPGIEKDSADWIGVYGEVALKGKPIQFENYAGPLGKGFRVSAYCPEKGYFVAIFEDITDRMKAEEALKASEEEYRLLFNSIDEGFCIIEVVFDTNCKPIDYRFLEVNSMFEQQTGLHNVVGKQVRSLVPAHEEHWFRIYGEVALSGKPRRFEAEAKALNHYYDVYAFPLGKKKPYRVGVLFKDIAERKKAEETLKENEQLYHTVFDNSQDGFQLIELVYDKHGKPIDHKFLRVNHAYEKIIGVKAEDILDKTAKYISPNQELHWLEVPDRVAKTGISEHVELYNKDIDKWLDCFYFRYSKNVVGTLFRDITERKKLEKHLQDSERLAAIGATAGMVGHDIRNPLQAITSDVYLAKIELASIQDSEEKKNALESMGEIEKNLDYINKIVQDLQDYARPLNPKIEENDLKSIVESFITKNGLPKNITVKVKITDEARKIKADSYYLNRILFNLVTNAVQAMSDGGKLTIDAHKEADETVLSVKDTGVGIPREIRDKMFTLMFTTKSKGQGFGLPVVKRLTESLGGTVTFESQEGKGTTFIVRLPPSQRAKQ